MKKSLIIVAFLILATSCWSFAENNKNYFDENFVEAIKDGFDRDLSKEPKAEWIGSGVVEILHIDAQPTTTIGLAEEGGEEYGVKSKVKKAELIKLRKDAPVLSRKKTTWAAWTDSDGLINLALNLPLEKAEDNAIGSLQTVAEWRSWDQKVDWYADVKNFIGCTRFNDGWVRLSNDGLTHIFLGEMKDEDSFSSAMKTLTELRIINP